MVKKQREGGQRKAGVGQQVLSLRKGVSHPIFEPLEGWVMMVFD